MTGRRKVKRDPRKTWEWALADISRGGRGVNAVSGFDSFTGDMLRANLITHDEFIAAQTVIAAACAGAKAMERAALSSVA